jgi:hypothetical protein
VSGTKRRRSASSLEQKKDDCERGRWLGQSREEEESVHEGRAMKEIEQRRRMSAMRSDSARSGYGAVSPVETSGGHQKVFTRRLSTIRQLRQDLVRLSLIKRCRSARKEPRSSARRRPEGACSASACETDGGRSKPGTTRDCSVDVGAAVLTRGIDQCAASSVKGDKQLAHSDGRLVDDVPRRVVQVEGRRR